MSDNMEYLLRSYGLVDIESVDPSIMVDLKYATEDNFMHRNLYGSLRKAFFVPEIAERLAHAQMLLRRENPSLSLLIYDAARPMSIQRMMFETVSGTGQEIYVASPNVGGGYHNYGLAADLTIADADGTPLDMGCGFDCFNHISHTDNEDALVEEGLISREAMNNRRLLRRCMQEAGFVQNTSEWWHFQRYSFEEMKSRFRLLDF